MPDSSLKNLPDIFNYIYENDVWGRGSGPGSSPEFNSSFLRYLNDLIADRRINSLLDVGCGDFQWAKDIEFGGCSYVGFDVSNDIIDKNKALHERSGVSFLYYDGDFQGLPKADAILCKDVLQHLPNEYIFDFFRAIGHGYEYAIIVNDYIRNGFPKNLDIAAGGYRLLDLGAAPFHIQHQYEFLYGDEGNKLGLEHLGKKAVYLFEQPALKQISEIFQRQPMTSGQRSMPDTALEIRDVLSKLTPQGIQSWRKCRVGRRGDGGYIMIDDLYDIDVCVSLGIGSDVSWDYDMAERGARILQYDHTVDAPPVPHANFAFSKIEIGEAEASDGTATTLAAIMRKHIGAGDNVVLKIDIEGFEWNVFDGISIHELSRFRQIVVEFHALTLLEDQSFRARAQRVFGKLNSAFFCCHVHGNNFGPVATVHGISFPDVLEVTFANRGRYVPSESREMFPTSLDDPCDLARPDIFLSSFRFF